MKAVAVVAFQASLTARRRMGSQASALRPHHMGLLHRTACLSLGFAGCDHQVAAFTGRRSPFPVLSAQVEMQGPP